MTTFPFKTIFAHFFIMYIQEQVCIFDKILCKCEMAALLKLGDGSSPDWQQVVDRVCELAPIVRREVLINGLREMGPALMHIARHGTDAGLEDPVLEHLRPGILVHANRSLALS